MGDNPWLTERAEEAAVPAAAPGPGGRVEERVWQAGPGAPGVPEVEGLGRVPVAAGGCWLVGAHGGAGTTSLARLAGVGDAGTAWPEPPAGSVSRVLVVARTHGAGITAAQRAAVQFAGGDVPGGLVLAGVVWVADAPGRLTRVLRERRDLVSGAFPTSAALPWVEAWREGEAWASPVPSAVRRVLRRLPVEREDSQ